MERLSYEIHAFGDETAVWEEQDESESEVQQAQRSFDHERLILF